MEKRPIRTIVCRSIALPPLVQPRAVQPSARRAQPRPAEGSQQAFTRALPGMLPDDLFPRVAAAAGPAWRT